MTDLWEDFEQAAKIPRPEVHLEQPLSALGAASIGIKLLNWALESVQGKLRQLTSGPKAALLLVALPGLWVLLSLLHYLGEQSKPPQWHLRACCKRFLRLARGSGFQELGSASKATNSPWN